MTEPDELLAIRDLIDQRLITADGRTVARVADLDLEWRPDSTLAVSGLLVGPQSLARRVSNRLGPVAHFLLRDRFEHRLPVAEIDRLELDVHLGQTADRYQVGRADRWVVDHILRFIPGNGR